MIKNIKKYNWKFWTKLFIGIIPLIAIFVVILGMYLSYCGEGLKYYSNLLIKINKNPSAKYNYDLKLIQQLADYYDNKRYFKILIFTLTRNIFLITTLGNILMSIFFISSAINNNNEGNGKIDNYKFGFVAIFGVVFIVCFFNLSLLISFNITGWYGYVSWIFLHSIVQIIAIIYFFLFYDFSKIDKLQKMKSSFLWTTFIVNGYMLFWIIIGSLLSVITQYRPFGSMSPSGYFPYDFIDVITTHKKIYTAFIKNSLIQLLLLMFIFELASILLNTSMTFIIWKSNKIKINKIENKITDNDIQK